MITYKCKFCKKEFDCYHKTRKFCSRKCQAEWWKRYSGSIKTCPICKKEFYKRSRPKAKYCSCSCGAKGRKTGGIFKCEWCGKETYKAIALQRQHKFCSKICANNWQGKNKLKFTCKICGKEFRWSKSRITQANPTYCNWGCRLKDREHILKNAIVGNLIQQNKKGLNKLELAGRKILEDIGIKFQEQVLMFNKFLVDVLVPEYNLVIQWDGTYWHNRPKRKRLDKSQDAYLRKCGYKVLRFTDEQIKNSKEIIYDNIKRAIQ